VLKALDDLLQAAGLALERAAVARQSPMLPQQRRDDVALVLEDDRPVDYLLN